MLRDSAGLQFLLFSARHIFHLIFAAGKLAFADDDGKARLELARDAHRFLDFHGVVIDLYAQTLRAQLAHQARCRSKRASPIQTT